MADPPSPGVSNTALPSAISQSRPTAPDTFHPVPVPKDQKNVVGGIPAPLQHQKDAGPSTYDYTENAPDAVVQAVAIERERERKEGPQEMMVGSWTSWAGGENDGGITPSSITRTHMRPGSRRASIASRQSFTQDRPSGQFRRQTGSQVDLLQSPSSGVFAIDSEDEDHGAGQRMGRSYSKRSTRRHSRAQSNQVAAPSSGYFSYRPDDHVQAQSPAAMDDDYEPSPASPMMSPARPSTTLGRIASYIGFSRNEVEDEEAALQDGHRRSYSHSRSRRGSGSEISSRRHRTRSRSPSTSEEDDWYGDEDDADSYMSERDPEEGYTSSLADDTSLPPQSRPTSPNMPLVPSATDGIFGEPNARPYDMAEPKDFVSVAVPSRQTVVLPDEDLSIRFTCYRTDPFRNAIWWFGCIVTFGALGLLGRWIPSIWVKFLGKETAFDEAKEGTWLVVETPYGDLHVIPLQIIPYPYPLSTVFPHHAATAPPTAGSSTAPSLRGHNGSPNPNHTSNGHSAGGGVGGVPSATDGIFGEPNARPYDMAEPKDFYMGQVLGKETAFDAKEGTWLVVETIPLQIIPYPYPLSTVYHAATAPPTAGSSTAPSLRGHNGSPNPNHTSNGHSALILVDGEWVVMDCAKLVPGDIFDASDANLPVFPCDAVLLSGDAIVNESMLTGESVPVSKIPVKDENLRSMSKETKQGSSEIDGDLAKHYLFSGTKIIRVRAGARPPWAPKSEEPVALAMVTRTGFNTTKGALVRSMLFPKPMGFKFYRDSMNFIGVLTIIAGLGFAVSAVQFIRIGIHWHTIALRALDLITIVVPPALPATLTIGTTFAIERLRKSGIFCISPNRVNIGGKINVVCFDKTGTLTEDGLDVLGVRTIDRQDQRFSELHSEIQDVPIEGGINGKTPLLYALATCHALKLIDGEVIGDPLDIKMFEYTGWTLDEGQSRPIPNKATSTSASGSGSGTKPQSLIQTVVRPPGTDRWKMEDALKSGSKHAHFLELGVIRTYDFVSALRRMSVIVKRLKSNSMEVYVKGAPEVMPDICDPSTFPLDYDDMLSYYTRNGFRVIAIAGKSIEGLTWLKAQRMRREVAESDLQFLGFIVFENKLKPNTAPNIHTLRAAHLACRMVTGDNVRTAISVARECGMVSHSASVYIPTFIPGTGTCEGAQLDWSSVDDERHKLDEYTLKPMVTQMGVTLDGQDPESHDYQLALTGDVFKWMLEYAELETMERMLVKGVIFARMSPDEKAELVERLQALGYTVAFCGDGANDCGALKAADVGVSLSEAEASVAAPFTSRIPDIGCMVEIIKEGRAALVTSFSCFKYMALYSMIQFTTVTLLYSFASSLGDFQFLYIDLFVIIPIAVAMGRTLPYPKIHPKRPTASLVSRKVLISIIGQIVLNSAVQIFVFVWVRKQSWYTPPDTNVDKLETFNYENSALFLVSCFQYILVAGVFSVGPPYRKPLYTNPSLVICLLGLGAFSTYVLLSPAQPIALILDIIKLPLEFKFELLLIAAINIAAAFGFERFGEKPISRLLVAIKRWRFKKRGRGYRAVEREVR
ncbi:hypothetical protein V865_002905 [Kwoniella europaea PYCC6329]|uniref:Cation-transporting ATPase n=1 Tax=Kwoniella europaea PYCC6329 TaxID=1423913 RepID=A0AAX4KFL6_9TREE